MKWERADINMTITVEKLAAYVTAKVAMDAFYGKDFFQRTTS